MPTHEPLGLRVRVPRSRHTRNESGTIREKKNSHSLWLGLNPIPGICGLKKKRVPAKTMRAEGCPIVKTASMRGLLCGLFATSIYPLVKSVSLQA